MNMLTRSMTKKMEVNAGASSEETVPTVPSTDASTSTSRKHSSEESEEEEEYKGVDCGDGYELINLITFTDWKKAQEEKDKQPKDTSFAKSGIKIPPRRVSPSNDEGEFEITLTPIPKLYLDMSYRDKNQHRGTLSLEMKDYIVDLIYEYREEISYVDISRMLVKQFELDKLDPAIVSRFLKSIGYERVRMWVRND